MFIIDDIKAAAAAGKLAVLAIAAAVVFALGAGSAELWERTANINLHAGPLPLLRVQGLGPKAASAKAAEKKAKADAGLWADAYRSEKLAVTRQNARIDRMGRDAADWQRRAQAATAEAHRANLKAQASAADFLKLKLRGATVCERAEDASAKINGDLR